MRSRSVRSRTITVALAATMALSIGLLAGGQVWVETGAVSWALAVGAAALVAFAVAWRLVTSRYRGARLVLFGHRLSGHADAARARSSGPGAGGAKGGADAPGVRPAAVPPGRVGHPGSDADDRSVNRSAGDPTRAVSTEAAAGPAALRPGRRPRRGSR